jgi:hypothetical protein
MKYFFIEKNQCKETGNHLLHHAECSILPDAENLYPLGVHVYATHATEKAARIFTPVATCPMCCPDEC